MNQVASILLHIDASARCRMRLEVARALARRLDAMVTALYASVPQPANSPSEFFVEGSWLMPDLSAFDARCRAQARSLVDAAQDGPRLHWAEVPQGQGLLRQVVREAWVHDLVVLGQRNDGDPAAAGVPTDFVESVVVGSGKPVLVVPSSGHFADVGHRVLVAWKPTREAARALSSALPLLQPDASVHVVAWGCDPAEVRPLLLRHGIQADYSQEATDGDRVGEYLLSRAADLDADLLVMGCYGHARARELLLGGVTRTVLRSMTLPVLMAH
ncbi:universal stress protein [Azohydromonas caseinilytica]|uniref:Universal stress protein n=1 Tax=Azohydromonas caseinilytica TaxID=2728836 RepID=A0A848FFN5_9BURK|nr:universal stress protein [Azohydromonas caseinilytica]NML17129.1 universal stress protein [Azohydromonas caseinilytica]